MSSSESERDVPLDASWVCSPIAVEWHEDWVAFREYMEQYQKDTHQVFRQRTSTSVDRRNREIQTRARLTDGSSKTRLLDKEESELNATGVCDDVSERLIPESFKSFWIKLVCTHGWLRKSRGTGQRKCHFDKSTGCKANVKAAVTWNDAIGYKKFMVRVTAFDVVHNHKVSKALYDNHSSNRRIENPTILAFVDELQAAGSKPKMIMQYLRKKTGTKLWVWILVLRLKLTSVL
ncbi:hypothetical protein DVH05_020370 [Phytophthora capsici]|nr:hypothetical protein DVH05_020370 [Phytophthora capsici]